MWRRRLGGRRKTGCHLVLLGGLFVLFTGLVVAMRLVNRDPVLILPEDREALAVQCPGPGENSLTRIVEAQSLLPAETPEPLLVPQPGRKDRMIPYRAERGSLARSLNIERPDDDPEFLAYLEQCEPVLRQCLDLLAHPCFPFPVNATSLGRWRQRPSQIIPWGFLLAVAAAKGRYRGQPAEAASLLADIIRLTRLADAPNGLLNLATHIEQRALEELRRIARGLDSEAELEGLQRLVGSLEPAYPDRQELLKSEWRIVDNTLLAPPTPEPDTIERRIEIHVLLWQLQRAAKFTAKHKDSLLDLVERPLTEVSRWVQDHRQEVYRRHRVFNPYWSVNQVVREVARVNSAYYATILAILLERYQRANGAYPESLDALCPDYLPRLPTDPIANAPFLYRRDRSFYVLYSLGEDGIDQKGNSRKDHVLVSNEDAETVNSSPPQNLPARRRVRRSRN